MCAIDDVGDVRFQEVRGRLYWWLRCVGITNLRCCEFRSPGVSLLGVGDGETCGPIFFLMTFDFRSPHLRLLSKPRDRGSRSW